MNNIELGNALLESASKIIDKVEKTKRDELGKKIDGIMAKNAARRKAGYGDKQIPIDQEEYVELDKLRHSHAVRQSGRPDAKRIQSHNDKNMLNKMLNDHNKLTDKQKAIHKRINDRTNNESVAELLIEAAELLNEGARWNKEISKHAKEVSSITTGRKLAKEIAKVKESENSMDRVLGYKKINENNRAIDNCDTNKALTQAALNAAQNDLILKKYGKNAADYVERHKNINDSVRYPSLVRERRLQRYRNSKSQNESISELLIEAAMLLTEGVGVKDKSTDKVVKVFKDNKEAIEWIVANGGNEKYRLTNELK